MKKVVSLFVLLIFLTAVVSAAELPNPASVKCKEDGYKTELRELEDGSQYGVCIFEDSECDEWQYFRGECKPEQCSKVEGYWNCKEGCYPPMECCALEIKCVLYEKEEQGFMALFRKYFVLIFAWLWIEEEDQKSFEKNSKKDFEKDLKKEEPLGF